MLPKTLPTAEKFCPLLLVKLDVSEDSFKLLLVHLGSLLGVQLKGIPNFPLLSFLYGSLEKLIIDGFLSEGPGPPQQHWPILKRALWHCSTA